MRRFNALVFDDLIIGGASVLTPSRYDAGLGQFDTLSLHAIVDDIDVGGSMSVFVDHSGDGVHWYTKSAGSAVLTATLAAGVTASKTATEPAGELSMAFVRLRLALTTTGRARVRLYATGRDAAG